MRDILVTGGTGQIGIELARQTWPEDVALHFPVRDELDIGAEDSIRRYFSGRTFAAVINAAAYTAVDKAESEADAAFRANALGPRWLADITRLSGIPLVQISTDYVFDGSKAGCYVEDDPVAPLGVYGASKQAGEDAVLSGNPRSLVLRTAWVLSAHRGNFLKTMLRLGATDGQVRVVDDQWGCPTAASDIASAITTIALRMIDDPASPTGIFHFVNAGETNWCGLAKEIFTVSGIAGGPTATVIPITTADYPTQARRPANSRLATGKITTHYGICPRDWRAAARDIIQELVGPVSPYWSVRL